MLDDRDEPLEPQLVAGPIADGRCPLEPITVSPSPPRARPADLDLRSLADLGARPELPRLRVVGKQADSPDEAAVFPFLDDELAEAVGLEPRDHPLEHS